MLLDIVIAIGVIGGWLFIVFAVLLILATYAIGREAASEDDYNNG